MGVQVARSQPSFFAHLQVEWGQLVQVAGLARFYNVVLFICLCSSVLPSRLWTSELAGACLLMTPEHGG